MLIIISLCDRSAIKLVLHDVFRVFLLYLSVHWREKPSIFLFVLILKIGFTYERLCSQLKYLQIPSPALAAKLYFCWHFLFPSLDNQINISLLSLNKLNPLFRENDSECVCIHNPKQTGLHAWNTTYIFRIKFKSLLKIRNGFFLPSPTI